MPGMNRGRGRGRGRGQRGYHPYRGGRARSVDPVSFDAFADEQGTR